MPGSFYQFSAGNKTEYRGNISGKVRNGETTIPTFTGKLRNQEEQIVLVHDHHKTRNSKNEKILRERGQREREGEKILHYNLGRGIKGNRRGEETGNCMIDFICGMERKDLRLTPCCDVLNV